MTERNNQLQTLLLWGIVALCISFVVLWLLGIRIPYRRAADGMIEPIDLDETWPAARPRPIEAPAVEYPVVNVPTGGAPERLLR